MAQSGEVLPHNNGFEDVAQEQYTDSLALIRLLARWKIYEYVDNPIDYYLSAYDQMGVDQNDSILDVGSFNTNGPARIVRDRGHTGPFVAVDFSDAAYQQTNKLKIFDGIPEHETIPAFVVGDGQELPFPDSVFDATILAFTGYHFEDPEKGLLELKRVTKPGGKLAVWTSGPSNKQRIHGLEEDIQEELKNQFGYTDIKRPKNFYEKFDVTHADKMLPKLFKVINVVTQLDNIHISDRSRFETLRLAYKGMASSYHPEPSHDDWNMASDTVLHRVVWPEVEELDDWVDDVERYLFILENAK